MNRPFSASIAKPERPAKALTDGRCAVDIRVIMRGIQKYDGNRVLVRWAGALDDNIPVATLFSLVTPESMQVRHVGGGMPAEVLDVVYSHCPFGGRRAWFACSKLGCGRRVAILYQAPRGFRCRHCMRLAYRSQREQEYDRGLRRARRIRQHVGGTANLFEPFPAKPIGMHWRTYDALLGQEFVFWNNFKSTTLAPTHPASACLL